MVSRDQVMAALAEVVDPELHRSIVDLNMVQDVQIDGDAVRVSVLLTVEGCPLRNEIKGSVTQRLMALEGVRHVEVTLGTMTAEQRQALVNRLAPRKEAKSRILDPESRTRIVGISSGKGGVGKSTVTVNLALALRRMGKAVGIIDADIYGFSIPRMLGLKGSPVVIEGALAPQQAYGLQVISMGSFVGEDSPVIWRGPMLMKALEQFLKDVLWTDLDYLLLDMPPGTGDVAISLYQLIPSSSLVLVTTPQPVASKVASRVAQMAKKTRQQVLGIVENMSYFLCPNCNERHAIFGSGGGEQLAKELGVPLLGKVPLVGSIREASDQGQPAVLEEDSASAQVFMEIAGALVAQLEGQPVAVRA